MKNMKNKIAITLASIGAIAGLVAGTFAAFTSDATSNDNTWQAGTLTLELSNDAATWSQAVTDTFDTPTNWAPGETSTDTLYVRNGGTINIGSLTWNGMTYTELPAGGVDMGDVVNVNTVTFGLIGTPIDITATLLATYGVAPYGNGDGILTLKELYTGLNAAPYNLGPISGSPAQYALIVTTGFDSSAPNAYQGASVEIDWTFQASQP